MLSNVEGHATQEGAELRYGSMSIQAPTRAYESHDREVTGSNITRAIYVSLSKTQSPNSQSIQLYEYGTDNAVITVVMMVSSSDL